VEELLQLQDKDWDDPYAASKKLGERLGQIEECGRRMKK
jgi:hypothetical protein